MSGTYAVAYHCSNCGHGFERQYHRGTHSESMVACPNCCCVSAGRAWERPANPVVSPMRATEGARR